MITYQQAKPPLKEFTVILRDGQVVKVLTSKLHRCPEYLYQCFLLDENSHYTQPFFELISHPSADDLSTALVAHTQKQQKQK